MTELGVRLFDDRDREAVWVLHEWAMRHTDTNPDDIPGTEDLDDISESYIDAGGAFLVGVLEGLPADVTPDNSVVDDRLPPATFDGTLVAMGGIVPNAAGHDDERTVDDAAELHRMRVAPTHQRRGYGRVLLEALEDAAHEHGFDVLLATTARTQPAAVEFYPSAGYEMVGSSTEAGYELVHFEKRLDT
ncbi:GNAT family N-acetyltransferase [Halomarina rubra]|uniref:GNAT family N-acetyltransferase n=1 Tax=Halomarina rubra TaxID=2071873 RepID=A0ABD6AX95_9EURY|nr:GNAT family N-acetyltransferase [Halomarina rubra]